MNELPICPIHKIHIIGKRCDQCESDKEYELEKFIEDEIKKEDSK